MPKKHFTSNENWGIMNAWLGYSGHACLTETDRVIYMVSARNSMLRYLSRGEQVTTKQARTMFKVSNVADLVYRLRNEGVPIYTNRITTSRGEETFAYRIGSPSQSFLRNLKSRHVARARRTLYAEALSA